MFILSKTYGMYTKSIYFTLVQSQALVKTNAYLLILQSVTIDDDKESYFKLLWNLYRLKNDGQTWWQDMSDALKIMRFCNTYILSLCIKEEREKLGIYVDSCLVFSPNNQELEQKVQWFKEDNSSICEDTSDDKAINMYPAIKVEQYKVDNFSKNISLGRGRHTCKSMTYTKHQLPNPKPSYWWKPWLPWTALISTISLWHYSLDYPTDACDAPWMTLLFKHWKYCWPNNAILIAC